jgi:hypothetical protein
MLTLWTKIVDWYNDEEKGASMVEYALLVVLIAIIALVAVALAGRSQSRQPSETSPARYNDPDKLTFRHLVLEGAGSSRPFYASGSHTPHVGGNQDNETQSKQGQSDTRLNVERPWSNTGSS